MEERWTGGEGEKGEGEWAGSEEGQPTTAQQDGKALFSPAISIPLVLFFSPFGIASQSGTRYNEGGRRHNMCAQRGEGGENGEKRREKKSLSSLLLRAAAVLRNNCCRLVRWRQRGPLMGTFFPHYHRHVVKILVVWVFRVIIFDEKKTRRNNCGNCPTWKNRQKQTHW